MKVGMIYCKFKQLGIGHLDYDWLGRKKHALIIYSYAYSECLGEIDLSGYATYKKKHALLSVKVVTMHWKRSKAETIRSDLI